MCLRLFERELNYYLTLEVKIIIFLIVVYIFFLILKICTKVANKTGPTRVADFRAVFTAERPYLFLGPETTYTVEQ